MKKNIKKIVISLLIIGIVATLAIGFAGCEKNLDGLYVETVTAGDELWAIKIVDNKIQFLSRDTEKNEFSKVNLDTTFTKNGDKLILANKYYEITELTITKEGNISGIDKDIAGEILTRNYIKQK